MSNKKFVEIASRFEMASLDGRVEFGILDDFADWWNSWECHLGDSAQTRNVEEWFWCGTK